MQKYKKKDEFLTARIDRIFKTILLDERNFCILDEILSEILNRRVKVKKVLPTELPVKGKDEKTKRLDAIVELDNEYINIEINTVANNYIIKRNFAYLTSLYSQLITRGKNYQNNLRLIQINLFWNMKKDEELINFYAMGNLKNNKDILVDNFLIVNFNVDRLKLAWYHKNMEEIEKYKYILMLDLNEDELKKLNQMYKGDEIMERYTDYILDINKDLKFRWLTPEEDERMLYNSYFEDGKNVGKKQGIAIGEKRGIAIGEKHGIAIGEKQGIAIGEKNGVRNIVQKMLNNGYSIEQITKATDLTEKKIQEILKK